jgi:hypothetical protein
VGRPQPRPHQPAPQQQRMGVATTGQHQMESERLGSNLAAA